jgi:hypothetical protein
VPIAVALANRLVRDGLNTGANMRTSLFSGMRAFSAAIGPIGKLRVSDGTGPSAFQRAIKVADIQRAAGELRERIGRQNAGEPETEAAA